MTADQYVSKYHALAVPEYEMQNATMYASRFINTPVDEYLNMRLTNRAGFTHADRWKFRKGIKDFLIDHAKRPDTPVYPMGSGYRISNAILPCAYIDNDMLETAFVGKASPETIFAVIQAISYWRGWRVLEEGTPCPPLPNLVDMFLGTDCNGFVGNYMKSKYSKGGFKLGPSTPEEDYFYHRQSIRDNPADVRADDIILVLRTAKGAEKEVDWKLTKKELEAELSTLRPRIGHIMVISSVDNAGSDRVSVMVSESRTSKVPNGGPQTRPFTIQRKSTYRWDMLNRDSEIHSIIKVKHTG